MRKDLEKWVSHRRGAHFEAKGSSNEVTNWDNLMSTYFFDNAITNSVAQSRLAAQTFAGQALNWWRAYSQLVPELVVSYEQLLEWVHTELVPLADPATATLAWRQLRFLGDVDNYLRQLDQLSIHFPIFPATLLSMAAEPLGREVVSAVYKADQMYGTEGMSYVRLRRFIQAYLQQLTPPQRKHLADNPPLAMGYGKSLDKEKKASSSSFRPPNFAPRNRPQNYAQANALEAEKALAKPSHPTRRVGKGTNPCWVCGSDRHLWYNCEKRKKGSCACCGSMAHMTRDCAQRYYPASAPSQRPLNVTPKEQTRSSRLQTKPNPTECDLGEMVRSSTKTSSSSKKKDKKKQSSSSSSSSSSSDDNASSDEANSETKAKSHRHHRHSSCIVQHAGSLSLVLCLPGSAKMIQDVNVASVTAKAMMDWPNIWGELSSQFPIGIMLQLAPITAPPRSSLLYYHVEVNRVPAVAMFDTGASQSFITYDLVDQLQATLTPLKERLTTMDFGGQKSSITHTA